MGVLLTTNDVTNSNVKLSVVDNLEVIQVRSILKEIRCLFKKNPENFSLTTIIGCNMEIQTFCVKFLMGHQRKRRERRQTNTRTKTSKVK